MHICYSKANKVMLKEKLREAENNIYTSLSKSYPAFINVCRVNGSNSPEDDAMDLQNDLFLKLREHIHKPQNIKILVSNLDKTKMYFRKQKGRAEGFEEEEVSIDIVQGKLLNISFKNDSEKVVSISVDTLSKTINNKSEVNNVEYIFNEIEINLAGNKQPKNNEILLNNNSMKPDSLNINVYPMEYTIQRSAKNLAIDQYSKKNKRNKVLRDIVIKPGDYKKEMEAKYSGYKGKEDDPNALTLNEKITTQENIRQNEDDIIEKYDLRKIKKNIDHYCKNKMPPKIALAINYWRQGMSGAEIATIMGESEVNIRKLIFKGRLKLKAEYKDNWKINEN